MRKLVIERAQGTDDRRCARLVVCVRRPVRRSRRVATTRDEGLDYFLPVDPEFFASSMAVGARCSRWTDPRWLR